MRSVWRTEAGKESRHGGDECPANGASPSIWGGEEPGLRPVLAPIVAR